MFRILRKNKAEEVELTISNRTVIRVLLLVLVSILVLAALQRAQHALVLVFTGFFLALALNAPVHWVDRHLPGKLRGKRSVATSVSFLFVVIILAAFIASIVPPLVKQTETFISTAPALVNDTRDQNSQIGKFIRHYHLEGQVNSFSGQLGERLKHASGAAVSTVTKLTSSIFSVLTILVITFMMLIEGPHWLRFLHELLPHERRKDVDRLSQDMYKVVKGFVNGQVLLAAIAAALIVPMLFILHISYPIALMVIIFICGLIPLVGHTIGAIIVTLVAVAHSPVSAAIILVYYILYQQIENYAVQPRIQANSTNMSPLLVFLAVVIGVTFSGLLGGLVAIPVAGCLRVVVLYYLRTHDYIADKPAIAQEVSEAKA